MELPTDEEELETELPEEEMPEELLLEELLLEEELVFTAEAVFMDTQKSI